MAFIEDSEILVEEFVEGRELTCGVMEATGKLYVFPVCEVKSKMSISISNQNMILY